MRCYGHLKRLNKNRVVKRVLEIKLIGARRKGRPRKRCIDSV